MVGGRKSAGMCEEMRSAGLSKSICLLRIVFKEFELSEKRKKKLTELMIYHLLGNSIHKSLS
jgi:hypothetical protein